MSWYGLLVSDTHCGSLWGLAHPDDQHGTDNEKALQDYTWDSWLWSIKQIQRVTKRIDCLMLNGDIIDGKQRKSMSTGLITADLQRQTEMAENAIEPLVDGFRPKMIIRTSGSDYHEGPDCPTVAMDSQFGIAYYPHGLTFEVDGMNLDLQHQPDGSSAIYKGTIIDREILWSIISESLKNVPHSDLILRSHLHYYHKMETHGRSFILSPAWQWQTPYARKRARFRWLSDVGMVLLIREESVYGGFQSFTPRVPTPEIAKSVLSTKDIRAKAAKMSRRGGRNSR